MEIRHFFQILWKFCSFINLLFSFVAIICVYSSKYACDIFLMQPAVSALLSECILNATEAGPTVHGAGEILDGRQRTEEGNMKFSSDISQSNNDYTLTIFIFTVKTILTNWFSICES